MPPFGLLGLPSVWSPNWSPGRLSLGGGLGLPKRRLRIAVFASKFTREKHTKRKGKRKRKRKRKRSRKRKRKEQEQETEKEKEKEKEQEI